MKKGLIVLLTILFATLSAHADYTKEQRLKDMQTMEHALSAIQKGLLYNKTEVVEVGVKELQSAIREVKPPKKKSEVMGITDEYTIRFTNELSKKMVNYSNKLLDDMKNGHKHSAAKSYMEVLNQCISCHNKVRPGK